MSETSLFCSPVTVRTVTLELIECPKSLSFSFESSVSSRQHKTSSSCTTVNVTRDSAVGVVIRLKAWTTDESWLDYRQSFDIFFVRHNGRTGSGPPNLLFIVCRGVKRPGLEAVDSLPTSVEVKNEWSYTFTPSFAFMTFAGTSVLSVQSKYTVTKQTVLNVYEPYNTHTHTHTHTHLWCAECALILNVLQRHC